MGKIKIAGLVCLVGFVFLFSQPSNAQNKLVNVDFETGDIGGWNAWAVTGDVSSEANHTPNGSYSASPSLNVENGLFQMGALIQEFVDIKPGSKIESSVWIKTENLRGPEGTSVCAILKLEFWENGKIIYDKETGRLTGSNDWEKVTISTTVPEGTDMVKCLLMLWNSEGQGNEGKAYFDDVSMIVTSE